MSFRRDDMHPVLSATRDNGAVNPEVELSADEASRVLGVSAAIVRKWCAQGEFAARRATIRGKSQWRVLARDVYARRNQRAESLAQVDLEGAGAWLSTSEAAAILKVTIQTIGRLCQNELLTSHLIPNGRGGERRISARSVAVLKEQRTTPQAGDPLWLSIDEAAALLNYSRYYTQRLIHRKDLVSRIARRGRLKCTAVSKASVEEYIAKRMSKRSNAYVIDGDEYVTPEGAASRLDLSVQRVYQYISRSTLIVSHQTEGFGRPTGLIPTVQVDELKASLNRRKVRQGQEVCKAEGVVPKGDVSALAYTVDSQGLVLSMRKTSPP